MIIGQKIRVRIKPKYRATVGGLPHNQDIVGRVSYIGKYFFNVKVAAGYQESILFVDLVTGNVVIA